MWKITSPGPAPLSCEKLDCDGADFGFQADPSTCDFELVVESAHVLFLDRDNRIRLATRLHLDSPHLQGETGLRLFQLRL